MEGFLDILFDVEIVQNVVVVLPAEQTRRYGYVTTPASAIANFLLLQLYY